jgi:hypothetical protein
MAKALGKRSSQLQPHSDAPAAATAAAAPASATTTTASPPTAAATATVDTPSEAGATPTPAPAAVPSWTSGGPYETTDAEIQQSVERAVQSALSSRGLSVGEGEGVGSGVGAPTPQEAAELRVRLDVTTAKLYATGRRLAATQQSVSELARRTEQAELRRAQAEAAAAAAAEEGGFELELLRQRSATSEAAAAARTSALEERVRALQESHDALGAARLQAAGDRQQLAASEKARAQLEQRRRDLERELGKSSKDRERLKQELDVLTFESEGTIKMLDKDARVLRRRLVIKAIWFRMELVKLERLMGISYKFGEYLVTQVVCCSCHGAMDIAFSAFPCGHSMCANCMKRIKAAGSAASSSSNSSSSNSGDTAAANNPRCAQCNCEIEGSMPNVALNGVMMQYFRWKHNLAKAKEAMTVTAKEETESRHRLL